MSFSVKSNAGRSLTLSAGSLSLMGCVSPQQCGLVQAFKVHRRRVKAQKRRLEKLQPQQRVNENKQSEILSLNEIQVNLEEAKTQGGSLAVSAQNSHQGFSFMISRHPFLTSGSMATDRRYAERQTTLVLDLSIPT